MIKTWRLPWFILRWYDADTCFGMLDEGWGRTWTPDKGVRLVKAGGQKYDAPELNKPAQRDLALAARDRVIELAPSDWYMATSESKDPDDFGRPLFSIQLHDGRDLASVLEREGYVK